MAKVGALIAKYQITNGGPIILAQVENEYSSDVNGYYMQYIEDQLHAAGIVVVSIGPLCISPVSHADSVCCTN